MESPSSAPLDDNRMRRAHETVFRELRKHLTPDGRWIGVLSPSIYATAVVIASLSIFRNYYFTGHHRGHGERRDFAFDDALPESQETSTAPIRAGELSKIDGLIHHGTDWLISKQQSDGGWGETDRNPSDFTTSLTVKSALILSDISSVNSAEEDEAESGSLRSPHHDTFIAGWSMDVLTKTDVYLRRAGGTAELKKRCAGNDMVFHASALMVAALAGLGSWNDVPQLPFERILFPKPLQKFDPSLGSRFTLPAFLVIGMSRFAHRKQRGKPIRTFLRQSATTAAMQRLEADQSSLGDFFDSPAQTALVVMGLTSLGHVDHPMVLRGLRFLLNSVNAQGVWSVDTDHSLCLTSLAWIAGAGRQPSESQLPNPEHLLSSQHPCGGWSRGSRPEMKPTGGDTARALLALAEVFPTFNERDRIAKAATVGIRRLIAFQKINGGIATFYRGWGVSPFGKSDPVQTATALRVLTVWKEFLQSDTPLCREIDRAAQRMIQYLSTTQGKDGSWTSLWYGNPFHADERDYCLGTAKVLRALGERSETAPTAIQAAIRWILDNQNSDGGWGGRRDLSSATTLRRSRSASNTKNDFTSSMEETATVLEALVPMNDSADVAPAFAKGLDWLLREIEIERWTEASPVRLSFTNLWYYDELHPLLAAVGVLDTYRKQKE